MPRQLPRIPLPAIVIVAASAAALLLLAAGCGIYSANEREPEQALQLVYRAGPENATPTDEQMELLVQVIARRVEHLDAAAPSVERLGEDRVLIELPGVEDAREAKALIGRTGHFEIVERVCADALCSVYEDRPSGLTGADMTRAFPGTDPVTNAPELSFELTRDAAQQFAVMTQRIFSTNATDSPDQLAFVLDGEVLVSAGVLSPILEGVGIIRGKFTAEEVRQLAAQIESGPLPVDVEEVSSSAAVVTFNAEGRGAASVAGWTGLLLALVVLAWLTVRRRKRRRERVSYPFT